MEEKQRRGFTFVGLSADRPTRFRYTVFWDELNFRRGQNLAPDEYRFAPRHDDADFFRQFFQTRRRQQSLFSRQCEPRAL
jgi:hypothetical protein